MTTEKADFEIFDKSNSELHKIAKEYNIKYATKMRKSDIIFKIKEASAAHEGLSFVEGCLEILDGNFGFLRFQENNYLAGNDDVYISLSQIRKFNLKNGHMVAGPVRSPKDGEKYYALLRVDAVNRQNPDKMSMIKKFEALTPYYPQEQLKLETKKENVTTRLIDLFTPIGKGQRGLIVAAPRTGKTVILQKIANSILTNHSDTYVIVLLIDERPEEVTEMRNILIPHNSEVVSSTFDETPKNHIQVAEMVISKAKRMTEEGKDVVILLDSITRLGRAYNSAIPSSGKVLSGGIDSNALHRPKKFFGSARNTTDSGSLTILATALVDTGSRMDQVIFEEFKGTGNMELVLDRSISDLRLYPAVDLLRSGTRREELLLSQDILNRMIVLRKYLKTISPSQGIEMLRKRMLATKDNEKFLASMSR
ncbi:MAG: transcription termination factor Rho [Candidatus Cloacimonadota bacterium]|nr:transcription termination factor Rho [Candidatus Cloacimonadota bacterium]